jgi:tRNA uridine 5-carboxymethylaminomethyl modification enzyme
MHIGANQQSGGRAGESAATGLSGSLAEIGLRLGRLKTGTPPRLVRQSIDFARTEPQQGDEPVPWFTYWKEDLWNDPLFHVEHRAGSSASPTGPYPAGSILARHGGQEPCYITHTSDRTREIILQNLHKSPMYSGVIEGVGPRYCPSIEDKFVRFADKPRHQIFLEPEGIATDEIYVNGFSTCLPFEVQVEMVRSIVGCEQAEILRPAYAVEYDFSDPTQLFPSLETRCCQNLFLAGQINGTSGYEEAAAQGIMAGINAARRVQAKDPIVLRRDQAYIGVLIDDLVTKGTLEPYRMFTSRAEYRLLLRQDNADQRLSPIARDIGLLPQRHFEQFSSKLRAIQEEVHRLQTTRHGQDLLSDLLKRPEMEYRSLPGLRTDLPEEVTLQVQITLKYAGYIDRQEAEVDRQRLWEDQRIPSTLDYGQVPSLRIEARSKLQSLRPASLGQAGRISGVTPADVSVLSLFLKRMMAAPSKGESEPSACCSEEHLDAPGAHNQCCGDL